MSVNVTGLPVGLAAGTLIETNLGARRVERLARGDKVSTLDCGYLPIGRITTRRVTFAEQIADPALRPVCIAAGALGTGLPAHDLYLAQQHRVCVTGMRAAPAGLPELLVPAANLCDGAAIQIMPAQSDITFVHVMLDGHHLMRANGLKSESHCPATPALCRVAPQVRGKAPLTFPHFTSLTAPLPQTIPPAQTRFAP